jgi:hypothetical protein
MMQYVDTALLAGIFLRMGYFQEALNILRGRVSKIERKLKMERVPKNEMA